MYQTTQGKATGMDRVGSMTSRVGTNVRRLRREQDISIRVLTERLADFGWEISVQGFSRLETGQRGITVDQLAVLAEAFNVPMADLLEPETTPACGIPLSGPEAELVSLISGPVDEVLSGVVGSLCKGAADIASATSGHRIRGADRVVRELVGLAERVERART